MHIITENAFADAAARHPNDALALKSTLYILKKARFRSPEELRKAFPTLDRMKYRDKWYVLDVGGNNLRFMFHINFVNGRIFVKHIVTHAEYDKLVKFYRENKE